MFITAEVGPQERARCFWNMNCYAAVNLCVCVCVRVCVCALQPLKDSRL